MNCFFYQTRTKYDNTGDALINKALLAELRKHGRLFANYGADIPQQFLLELGLREDEKLLCTNNRQFAMKTIGYALTHRQDQVYIISGLGDSYGGNAKVICKNILSAGILLLCSLAGIKNVRIGRSFGILTKGMQWSEWLRGLFVSSYFVRDTQSLQRCRDMGIQKVQLCPDMSWLYEHELPRTENTSDTVMINMKASTLDVVDQKYVDSILEKCRTFLHRLEKIKGCDIPVIVAYQVEEDAAFSEYLYQQLRNEFSVRFVEKQMQLRDLKTYYSQCGFHLSNRMHSILSGYKYGSVPVAIIDTKEHLKIAATMADCNLSEYVIDVFEEHPEPEIDYMINNKSSLYHKIIRCEAEQSARIDHILSREFDP